MIKSRAFASVSILSMSVALCLTGGCASSTGLVVGAEGQTRSVKADRQVEIRLPATMQSREWRLTSFDSSRLTPIMEPTLMPTENGSRVNWITRFRAVNPGETSIEFTRTSIAPGAEGTVGEVRLYRFRVYD